MKGLLITALLASLLLVGRQAPPNDAARLAQTEPFVTIVKVNLTPAQLTSALKHLPLPAKEPPTFWSHLANDSHYPAFHRRTAIFQLLKRHTHAGMKLSDFARLLDHPTWLQPDSLGQVTILLGWIPVAPLAGKVFWFSVPSDPGGDAYCVYVRVLGDVDLQGFKGVLLTSGRGTAAPQATVAEIGFSEDREHWWNTFGQH